MSNSILRDFFKGLQFSTTLLLGMTVGTGVAVPITLWRMRSAGISDFGDLTPEQYALFGLYILSTVMLGTWVALGALGKQTGKTGGRPLRLAVQIAGIAVVAFLTLPCAAPATFLLMLLVGSARNTDERRLGQ